MFLKLTDAHLLDEFIVKIGSYRIVNQDVRDMNINWQINEIYTVGEIQFVDSVHMIEHKPVRVNDEIEISMTDAIKENYKQTFIITDISELRVEKNEVVAVLKFIDKNSFEYMRSFRSKGFSHAKSNDIAKFLLDEYKKDDKSVKNEISGEKKWGNEEKSGTETHVLPGDRTVMNNLYRLMSEGDFVVFQSRKNINMTEWKKLTSAEQVEYRLKMVPGNMSYLGKMGDYEAKTSDALSSNTIMPDQDTMKIKHYDGKKIIKKDLKYDLARDESGKCGSTDIEWVKGNGTKIMGYMTNTSESGMYNYKKYVNNMIVMECVVPGTFKRDIGKTIDVQLETLDISQDIDKNMSGKWVIIKIVDKTHQGFFTQKLTLARSVQK